MYFLPGDEVFCNADRNYTKGWGVVCDVQKKYLILQMAVGRRTVPRSACWKASFLGLYRYDVAGILRLLYHF